MKTNTILDIFLTQEFLHRIFGAGVVILMFVVVYLLNNFLFSTIHSKFPHYLERPLKMLRAFIRGLIVLIGLIAVLDQLGADVMTLIASFGITGFIITFALKDVLTSALSGAMVMIYRPFKVGDRIRISDIEGIVDRIELQYTIIISNGKEYTVPNSKVATEAITIRDLDSGPSE